jgi:hypothetical protein
MLSLKSARLTPTAVASTLVPKAVAKTAMSYSPLVEQFSG